MADQLRLGRPFSAEPSKGEQESKLKVHRSMTGADKLAVPASRITCTEHLLGRLGSATVLHADCWSLMLLTSAVALNSLGHA